MIITTIVYDRKLLESAKAANDAMQKMLGDRPVGKPKVIILDSPEDKKK